MKRRITGFAGHNRGKKFVRGVGYVSAPPAEISKPKCTVCDQPAWRWFTISGYVCRSHNPY